MSQTCDRPLAPLEPARRDDAGDPFVGRLVDFRATARRIRRSGTLLGGGAVGTWIATSVPSGTFGLRALFTLVALALAGMFVVEVVVVGGSAARGMLRAGEEGERLAGPDVGLLPTQLRRRRGR